MALPLQSINVDFYGSASRSCQAKHASTAKLIQPYLNALQIRLGLPGVNYEDLGEKGGAFSQKDEDVMKWWFEFFKGQPDYWIGLKYSIGTLPHYMGSIKNQLTKKLMLSRFVKVIEESHKSADKLLKVKIKELKKITPGAPKNKVYSSDDIIFILQRCLWFNLPEYLEFFCFQTALLRLCSRATETSRLTVQHLSVREVCEGRMNKVLQCWLTRDKMGVDNNYPLIPNKACIFGDLVVAIGLVLFIGNGNNLMPSIARLGDTAVPDFYTKILKNIWRRYHPVEGSTIRKGTSHWGKHTAQYLLDGAKLHTAAELFGGWDDNKVSGPRARTSYFSNAWPYLLDGAKSMAGWSKINSADYERVEIPSYDTISKELGDKILHVFFGHVDLAIQVKKMILV